MDITTQESNGTTKIAGIIKLLRPKQWIKNTFVLAPLVFSGAFAETASILSAFIAALLFCIASSSTYILNDYHDIENDRKHPVKRHKRPLASGVVSKKEAIFTLAAIYSLLVIATFFFPYVMGVIFSYMALNVAYTLYLKHQPVLDIFTIASGFVLRVYAGAVALSVPVSSWMFVTTLCLTLYLAAIKRRQELLQIGDNSRKVLQQYSISLIDRYAEMSAIGSLLFYSLFVMTTRPELVITIPFVLYGLFRYWFVVETLNEGESPTDALLSDWQLIFTIVIWVGTVIWALLPAGL